MFEYICIAAGFFIGFLLFFKRPKIASMNKSNEDNCKSEILSNPKLEENQESASNPKSEANQALVVNQEAALNKGSALNQELILNQKLALNSKLVVNQEPALNQDSVLAPNLVFDNISNDELNKIRDIVRRITVIIPARNEETNIVSILSDLSKQDIKPGEIILVDDASTDKTTLIAKSFDINVLLVENKPDNWMGKSYACNFGALSAKGDLFLFVDADVRLAPDAIARLALTYSNEKIALSIQPYHTVDKFYEHASFFFNLNLIAANGVGLPFKTRNAGLFGPLIFISKEDYDSIGGHFCARSSVVDDLKLGEVLYKKGIPTRLYWGDRDFSFKMYRNGIKDLFWGWSKNFATGVTKTPFLLIVFMFFWFYSATAVSILFLQSLINGSLNDIILYGILYLAWVFELMFVSRNIGSFKKHLILFYPVLLLFYFLIFATSIIKKIFHIKTVWKGRKVTVNENVNTGD